MVITVEKELCLLLQIILHQDFGGINKRFNQLDIKEEVVFTSFFMSEFPVTVKLKYQIRKTEQLFMVDCQTEIVLFTAGMWEININH